MEQKNEQRQEQFAQNQYSGYAGSPEQPFHSYNYQQDEEQYAFYQRRYRPVGGFEQSYGQQQVLAPALSFNGTAVAAILCYSLGWFTGLLFFLFAGQNRFVRFHALQSLVFFGAVNVLDFAFMRLEVFRWLHIPSIAGFALLFFLLMNIIAFVGWIVAMIQAARGRYYKLPFVGDSVASFINRGATLN